MLFLHGEGRLIFLKKCVGGKKKLIPSKYNGLKGPLIHGYYLHIH